MKTGCPSPGQESIRAAGSSRSRFHVRRGADAALSGFRNGRRRQFASVAADRAASRNQTSSAEGGDDAQARYAVEVDAVAGGDPESVSERCRRDPQVVRADRLSAAGEV